MAANWSEIPEELVSMVVERLVCIDDLIRFRAVCKPWRSVSIPEKQKKAYAPVMMLAMADNDNLPSHNNDGQGSRSFMIPSEGSANKMRSFDIELPKAQGRRCWGSPYGWMVTVGVDLNINLLNPLSGVQLPLPPQPILQEQSLFRKQLPERLTPEEIITRYTRKFALGWYQSSQSWLVMAIFGRAAEVAFAFAGIGTEASSWTCIESSADIQDVIFFRGRIFLMGYEGNLSVCDIKEGTPPKAIQIAPPPKNLDVTDRFYLVEMGGNLHLVLRFFDPVGEEDDYHYETRDFAVLRFSFRKNKWRELENLGEYALFLGNNTSFAISTTTYPHFKRNCVYFTDDHYTEYRYQFCDMGVSNYEEERVVDTFDNAKMGAFSKFSRPIFFMPTL